MAPITTNGKFAMDAIGKHPNIAILCVSVLDDDVGEITSRAVPITSYSSSEDEEFFDADEERSPKASPE